MACSVRKAVLKHRNLCGALLVLAAAVGTLPCALAQSVVKTASGLVSGFASGTPPVQVYEGIPYAAPPVGPLRWQPPQPPVAWQGVRKADHFSASCMQTIRGEHLPWTRAFMAQYPISEDCLYLNVWTPSTGARQLRPVLIWIHGGGFVEGAASPAVYNGEHLAGQGIVVVSINYRLGVFGFMAYPGLSAESPRHASGDYGLEDTVAALNWVHRNIAAFGGDPERVTIAGQSSGAAAVIYLTASPLAKGLFRGAIIESGAYITPPATVSLAEGEAQGSAFAAAAGEHTLGELRAMPAADLLAAQKKAGLRFRPDVDGWFLPATIPAIFAAGRQNDVPTIAGLNADEESYSAKYGRLTPDEFRQQARERYGDQADEFLKLYPAGSQAQATLSEKASARDSERVSMYLWAVDRAKTAKTPAYTYFFDRAIPWPEHPEFGAFHSAEIPYWFRNLDVLPRPFTALDRSLSQGMSGYWARFIETGSPNRKGLPHWPTVATGGKMTMQLGAELHPIPVADGARFTFWKRVEERAAAEK